MSVFILRSFIHAASWLPLPVARQLGRLVGELTWRRRTRAAVTTQINLELCRPDLTDGERSALARESLRNWGMTMFEVPIIWRKGRQSLDYIQSAHGQAVLEKAINSGRGLILISPHLGNWELTGLWVSSLGPMTTLYQPPKQEKLEAVIRAGRGKAGATLVPTNLKGVSALIKALKKGEITGILPDMEPDISGGLFAPFFGVSALTMTLVHSLQQRTGAQVLLAFAKRVERGFTMEILEPESRIYDSDPLTAVSALNNLVERSVLMAPEQYQWEYKRFKQRPEGESKLYPKGV